VKTKSLTDKLKENDQHINKRKIFNWTQKDNEILNSLINEIKKADALKFPDFNKPFYLNTDACDFGLGSVLYQDHGVISYYSKKLNGAELNYSIIEKEFLGILRSLQYFRNII